jgi:hypothetical protein
LAKKRGYGANKKILRRKRHIAIDAFDRQLMINLATPGIADSAAVWAIRRPFANDDRGSSICLPTAPEIEDGC